MIAHRLLIDLPLLALLMWAAVGDLRTRRIPNWLTFSLALAGIGCACTARGVVGPLDSVLGLAIGFGLTFAMFAIGALGGGDVKLLAGVGAWVGPTGVLAIFAVEAILGMLIVVSQALYQGRTRLLFRNSARIAMNFAYAGELGVDDIAATGQSCRSVDRPLPYAVPVLLATLLVVARPGMG